MHSEKGSVQEILSPDSKVCQSMLSTPVIGVMASQSQAVKLLKGVSANVWLSVCIYTVIRIVTLYVNESKYDY